MSVWWVVFEFRAGRWQVATHARTEREAIATAKLIRRAYPVCIAPADMWSERLFDAALAEMVRWTSARRAA